MVFKEQFKVSLSRKPALKCTRWQVQVKFTTVVTLGTFGDFYIEDLAQMQITIQRIPYDYLDEPAVQLRLSSVTKFAKASPRIKNS